MSSQINQSYGDSLSLLTEKFGYGVWRTLRQISVVVGLYIGLANDSAYRSVLIIVSLFSKIEPASLRMSILLMPIELWITPSLFGLPIRYCSVTSRSNEFENLP